MCTYRRSVWKLFLSILLLPLAPFAVCMVFLFFLQFFPFTWLFVVMIIVTAGILLYGLYNIIWGDRISFTISETGQCQYFQGGKEKHTFALSSCDIGYHRVKDMNGGLYSLKIRITDSAGTTTVLDCEPLGNRQFDKMFSQMQEFNRSEPDRLDPIAVDGGTV